MDYQEAIKEAETQINMYESMILYNKDFEPKNDNSNYERKIDLLKTAISAMQELQFYKDTKLCLIPEDVYGKQCDELDRYNELGTLEEVREAVERQQAKKHSPMIGIYGRVYECKECGNELEIYSKYCPFCGQKQDWE